MSSLLCAYLYYGNMITLKFSSSSIHAVEELRLSIENADYMVKENVVSFVAAVVASQAADFEYTVNVETSDDTAVGKRGGIV